MAMFEQHLLDLFGNEIDDWMKKNNITVAFSSWTDAKSETEDADLAFEFSHTQSGGRALICAQGQLRESVDFPQDLLDHLVHQASL